MGGAAGTRRSVRSCSWCPRWFPNRGVASRAHRAAPAPSRVWSERKAARIELAVGEGEAGPTVVGVDAQAACDEPDALRDTARRLVVWHDPCDHRLHRVDRCCGLQPGGGKLAGVPAALVHAGDAIAEVPRPGAVTLGPAEADD